MPTPVAESRRLYLVPLTLNDHLESYHALYSDEKVARWSNRPPTKDLADARNLMESRLPSPLHPYIENYAIVLKSGNDGAVEGDEHGRMIGVLGIPRLSHDGAAAEVGYGIHADYWGLGYATEVLVLFTEYYFSSSREFQKDVLIAETEPENVGSERVLAKAGFIKGELVKNAFEVTDPVTGSREWRDAVPWSFGRPGS